MPVKTRNLYRLNRPYPSLLLLSILFMSSHKVGGSSPSSLTLLLCLQTPQDSRGVSKQKWRRYSDTSAFQITILTYLLTSSGSWALLEKLPIVQPLKNFPTFYGTRRFISAFTRALHWSLS
jgi:hypothetical protein